MQGIPCVLFDWKTKTKKYSNFIIGRQRKNTPHPIHHQSELQTVLAWLTDPASLPTRRGPSEIPVRDFRPIRVLRRATPRGHIWQIYQPTEVRPNFSRTEYQIQMNFSVYGL